MPAGFDVTVPLPLVTTVSMYDDGGATTSNVATHVVSAFNMTVPLAHPAPLQPMNDEPLAGVGVSVTVAPVVNAALQVAPQLMPDGLEVTVPVPVPDFATVKVLLVGGGANPATPAAAVP